MSYQLSVPVLQMFLDQEMYEQIPRLLLSFNRLSQVPLPEIFRRRRPHARSPPALPVEHDQPRGRAPLPDHRQVRLRAHQDRLEPLITATARNLWEAPGNSIISLLFICFPMNLHYLSDLIIGIQPQKEDQLFPLTLLLE